MLSWLKARKSKTYFLGYSWLPLTSSFLKAQTFEPTHERPSAATQPGAHAGRGCRTAAQASRQGAARGGQAVPIFEIYWWHFLREQQKQQQQQQRRNPTIFTMIRWVAGLLGWLSHRPSVWWSKYYFDRLKIKQWVSGLELGHSKLFIFIFVKL